jgi:hypothetical protein
MLQEFTPTEYAEWIEASSDRQLLEIMECLRRLHPEYKRDVWEALPEVQRERLKAIVTSKN